MFSDPTVISIESRTSSGSISHRVSFRAEPGNDTVYSVEGLDPNHGYVINLRVNSAVTVSAYLPNGQLLGTDKRVNITGVTRFYIITRSLGHLSYNFNSTIYEYTLLQSASFDVSSVTIDGTDSVRYDISIYPEVVSGLSIYAYSENNNIAESGGNSRGNQREVEILGQHAGSTRVRIEVHDTWMRDYEDTSYVFYIDVSVTKPSVFSGNDGDGSEDNPYLIATPDDLQNVFKYGLVYNYRQVADIDLQGYPWEFHYTSGAFVFAIYKAFRGTYDGGNFAIRNLEINEDNYYVSLFGGVVGQDSRWSNNPELEVVIKNVRLLDYEIIGSSYSSALVGEAYEVKIINCHTRGKVTPTTDWLFGSSGLVGDMYGGEIIGCSADVEIITAKESYCYDIGGLIGCAWRNDTNPVVKKSFTKGYIKADEGIGGLVGGTNDCTFTNCYSELVIDGSESLGGFLGWSRNNVFENCYSVGKVVGQEDVGGFVGRTRDDNTFTSCYYDSETSGQSDTGKGEPRTTAQMKTQSTFVDWDFENVWNIVEGLTYPTFTKRTAVQCVAVPLSSLM